MNRLRLLCEDGNIQAFFISFSASYDAIHTEKGGALYTRDGPVTSFQHLCMLPQDSVVFLLYDQ